MSLTYLFVDFNVYFRNLCDAQWLGGEMAKWLAAKIYFSWF